MNARESALPVLVAVVRYGIPLAFAVWIAITLARIRMQLEEIAQALGCPLGTVKSNLHKAVAGLKALLLDQKELLSYD